MKVTKSYIQQLVKEELQRKLQEGERFDAMLAKKKAERRYQDNKAEIDPLKDRFQTDDRYKDSAYIDDIMAVAPELTREQAIEIAELFSDEVGMADRLNEEQEKVVVRNYPSNSGEPRYYVKIGDNYYQTREEVAKDIEQNGYDRSKHDYDLSKISPDSENHTYIAQKMKNI